jgi:hypothetical protein
MRFVRTAESKAAAAARIGAALARRKRAELLGLLRRCFARTEPWLQAGRYAAAVMSQIPRRNGWTIAAQAGDHSPDKTQRLLSHAVRDTFAAMRVVRRFALAGLDEAARTAGRLRVRQGLLRPGPVPGPPLHRDRPAHRAGHGRPGEPTPDRDEPITNSMESAQTCLTLSDGKD